VFTTSAKDEEKITRTWPVTIARKYSNEYQREETVKINHDKEGSTDNDNIDYDDSKEKTDTLKTMFWQNPWSWQRWQRKKPQWKCGWLYLRRWWLQLHWFPTKIISLLYKPSIPRSCILLDIPFTVDVFYNGKLLSNKSDTNRNLVLHCDTRKTLVTKKVDLKGSVL